MLSVWLHRYPSIPNGIFNMPVKVDQAANNGNLLGYGQTNLDSNHQTSTQGLNFSQETRPKSKFFSLLIYAGYPIA